MTSRPLRAWTDYPISALGDAPGEDAPIRECFVLAYDGSKYLTVEVDGVREQVKSGYVYMREGRRRGLVFVRRDGGGTGAAPCLTVKQLRALPRCS